MSEEITITKEDLVLWLDRPPSNDDLDLCEYLANAVQNRQKYYEENQQLKERCEKYCEQYQTVCDELTSEKMDLKQVLDEIREYINKQIREYKYVMNEVQMEDYVEDIYYMIIRNFEGVLQILDKAGNNG